MSAATALGARRVVPCRREPQRPHARRLGRDVRGSRRRPPAELRRAVRAHRGPARPRAALPPADRARRARAERAAVGRRRGLRSRRAHPPLGRRAAGGPRRRRAVGAAAARPPAVGVLDRARAGRRPHRARRQGPPLHGRRPRRGRARHAAARLRARSRAAGRGGRVAAGARAARARAGGARRVGPHARAARAAEGAARSSRARRSRCPSFALRTGRALAGAVLPVAPPSLLNAPELARPPPRHRAAPARRAARDQEPPRRDRQRRRCSRRSRARCAATPSAARSARATSRRWCRSTCARDDGGRARQPDHVHVRRAAGLRRPIRSTGCGGSATRRARARRRGVPEDADAAMQALSYAPRTLQKAAAHALASPRVYNLVVSNIPGPRMPMYMRGCRLREAYPVVPLSERHALSIGMTTIGDRRLLRALRRPGDAAGLRRCSRSTCTRRSTSCVPPWSHGRHHADPLRARRRGSRRSRSPIPTA